MKFGDSVVALNRYEGLKLSETDVAAGAYKQHLGGGSEKWEQRGRFQVALMRHFGLRPEHRLTDYGCGPVRAGRYFMQYLDAGGYRGCDYNADFIRVARDLVAADPVLSARRPDLRHVEEFLAIEADHDFLLLFSVLNHCRREQRQRMLDFAKAARPGSVSVVTHGYWLFRGKAWDTGDLQVEAFGEGDLPQELDILRHGWEPEDVPKVFPILKFTTPGGQVPGRGNMTQM